MTDYKALAATQKEYTVSMRRYFHQHPELSDCEDATCAKICEELAAMEIPYVNVPRGGVFAFLGNESKGRTVLLRADVDALPGKESPVNGGGQPKVVVSENDTASHTCGHDCHIAMLLGAAKALKSMEDQIPGRLILMFERGEESTGNIRYLLKYAFEQNWKIDSSFGLHVFPYSNTGTVAISTGHAMAGIMAFRVTLMGKTAHGSSPVEGINPIDCFVALYNTIQSLRMRFAGPFDPMTGSICQINSGFARNIIPPDLTFSGTFRVFNHEDAMKVKEELAHAIETTAELYHCKANYAIGHPSPSLYNDPECAAFTKEILRDAFGADAVLDSKPLMVSESHSLTSRIWPGTYGFVGIRNEAKGMTALNHHECFEPDEDALALGVASHLAYALEFLKQGPDTSDKIYQGTLKDLFAAYAPHYLAVLE